jgi:hypothetical protein
MKLSLKKIINLSFISLCFLIPISCIGCGDDEYNYGNVGVGVSKRTVAFLNGDKLDLSSELDPAQIPEIIKNSYIEAAELKKKDKELIRYVIQDISSKIAGISSIDLNKDEIPDPILIVPEGDKESMTYSIRIPDPEKVKTYPDDADAWQKIAENQSIEVLSVTVFPKKGANENVSFDVEARANEQVYERHHSNYYHSSFAHSYFTYRMMGSMFFNPYYGGWYGPGFYGRMGYYRGGYYGSYYGGRNVGTTRTTRKTYNKSSASKSAMKNSSGKSVQSKMHSQKSSGVSNFKNSAIKKRNASSAKKASGFGSSRSSGSKSSSYGFGRSKSRSSSSSRGSRGFGK